MKSFFCCMFIVFIVQLALSSTISTSAPQQRSKRSHHSDWSGVVQLPAGQKIKIRMQNGETLTGTLQNADSEGLVLLKRGEPPRKVGRLDIRSVVTKSRARAAMWGALTGAALGAGIGAAAGCADCYGPPGSERAMGALWLGGFFGGIGAGIGAAAGMENKIYEAPPRKAP